MQKSLGILTAILLALSGSLVSAAERTTKEDQLVDTVLNEEARGALQERTAPLAKVRDESTRARWASGFVERGGAWERYTLPDQDPQRAAYRAERGTETLTAARHAALAEWCFEHDLREEGRAHLTALLYLNPQQPAIWQKLGYQRVGNDWVHPDDLRAANERQTQLERDYKFWRPRVQAIVQKLTSPNPGQHSAGRQQLQEIDDRGTLSTLEAALCGSTPELAVEFLDWAKRRPSVESTTAIARQSVIAPWEPVRTAAAEALKSRRPDHYAPLLLSLLATPFESRSIQPTFSLVRGRIAFFEISQRETASVIDRRTYLLQIGEQPQAYNRAAVAASTLGRVDGNIMNVLVNQRNRSDLSRRIDQAAEQRRLQREEANRAQAELNARTSRTLALAADTNELQTPAEWWGWWFSETATEADGQKILAAKLEVDEFIPETPPMSISIGGLTNPNNYKRSSCLPAGTPIRTAEGWQAIETIRIGDRVLAKSIGSGELAERPVVWTTVRSAQPLVRLHFGQETIAATRGHYFWASGKGWRMAKELKAGDRLHTVDGTATLTDVSPGPNEPVYNLVVDQANSYFVGQSLILSHDVTPPIPTNVIVPGLQP